MNSSAIKLRSSPYLIAVVLSVGLFLLYNANLREINSVDTLPATLQPVSLLESHDLTLNEFEFRFEPQPQIWQAGFIFGALQRHEQQIISSYPPGTALIAAPFFSVARAAGILGDDNWLSYRLAGKLTAAAIVALSAAAVFLGLVGITGTWPAVVLALAYGVGTAAYSTASQALWQHGPGMLCLALAVFTLLRIDTQEQPRQWLAFSAGFLLALAVVCRNLNVFPAGIFALYMLIYHRRLLLTFMVPAISIAGCLVYYNYMHHNNLSGGYDAILDSPWHRSRNLLQTGLFNHPLLAGLLDTWISPSKGILIYSPFVIFAFAPLLIPPSQHRRLLVFLFLWLVMHSIALAKNTLWWGGTSFGPRYFLELGYLFVLLIGLCYRQLPSLARYGLLLLIGISMTIQTFGAFYAPCGWADTPNFADFNPERHWDWRDTEIERCVRRAYSEGPIEPTFTLNEMFE